MSSLALAWQSVEEKSKLHYTAYKLTLCHILPVVEELDNFVIFFCEIIL